MKNPVLARRRRLFRALGGIFISLALFLTGTSLYQAVASQQELQAFPAPGKRVDVGGYNLHINCTGNGSPTVVFEGGLGSASLMWSLVQPAIALHTRACSYDRAGYGWSDAATQPRTGVQIALELHTLLERAGEPAPYVLVGHSFGGIVIRLYASRYPAEVAGLVFVDARHEDFFKRLPPTFLQVDETNQRNAKILQILTPLGLTRLAGNIGWLAGYQRYLVPLPESQIAAARARMFYNSQHWQTSVAERELIEGSFDAVRKTRLSLDLPIIVLTARNGVEAWRTSDTPIDKPTREIWMSMQQDLAALTGRSQWIIVENSGHYIQLDRPDVLADTILRNFATHTWSWFIAEFWARRGSNSQPCT